MRSIFVDGHRLRDAGVHFGTATGDLGIPCVCGAGLGFRVEAADQFECESGTFLVWKTEDLGCGLPSCAPQAEDSATHSPSKLSLPSASRPIRDFNRT